MGTLVAVITHLNCAFESEYVVNVFNDTIQFIAALLRIFDNRNESLWYAPIHIEHV